MSALNQLVGNATSPQSPPFDIQPGLLRAAEQALCKAWALIHDPNERLLSDPATASEDDITFALQRALLTLLHDQTDPIDLFSTDYFAAIERSPEVASWDGKRINKKPDFLFRVFGTRPFRARHDAHGIFIECKLLEVGKGLDLYRSEGIKRFLSGEYAWLMTSAFMLGYVRARKMGLPKLVSYLEAHRSDLQVVRVGSVRSCLGSVDGDVLESTHDRVGVEAALGQPAGELLLTHLWFRASTLARSDPHVLVRSDPPV